MAAFSTLRWSIFIACGFRNIDCFPLKKWLLRWKNSPIFSYNGYLVGYGTPHLQSHPISLVLSGRGVEISMEVCLNPLPLTCEMKRGASLLPIEETNVNLEKNHLGFCTILNCLSPTIAPGAMPCYRMSKPLIDLPLGPGDGKLFFSRRKVIERQTD